MMRGFTSQSTDQSDCLETPSWRPVPRLPGKTGDTLSLSGITVACMKKLLYNVLNPLIPQINANEHIWNMGDLYEGVLELV